MDHHSLQPKIRALAEATVTRLGFDLVAVEWVGGRRGPILRLSIDAPGGVNAEDCARVSDAVSPLLDAADPIEVPYHLEVSSPGIDRPIRTLNAVERFSGQRVTLTTHDAIDGRRNWEGDLLGPRGNEAGIRTEDGVEHWFEWAKVKMARLVVDPWADKRARGGRR